MRVPSHHGRGEPRGGQRVDGHASIQTTMNYINLAPTALDTGLDALNNWRRYTAA